MIRIFRVLLCGVIAMFSEIAWQALPYAAYAQKVSDPASSKAPGREPRRSGVFYPEDCGEDFTPFTTKELLRHLATAKNIGDLRKSAKIVGDRALDGTLDLDNVDREILKKYIAFQILHTGTASTGKDQVEANHQLQRLWRLCIPELLDNVGHAKPNIRAAVAENLCLMRDESLVKELIARVEASKDQNYREAGVYTLGMMCEKRDPAVPDRKTLDDEASKELAERFIVPFLDRIEATAPDPVRRPRIDGYLAKHLLRR